MSKSKTVMVTAFIGLLTLSLAAEARRGFSGGGSGGGTHNNQAASPWLASDTADADCQTLYNLNCSDLSAAQLEDVTTKNAQATSNNYGSHTDFADAEDQGYTATPADGTLWTQAKGETGAFNTDCDSSFSSTGGCDAVSKNNYSSISGSSGRTAAIAAGFASYDDYLSASALGYSQTSADGSLWLQANNGTVSSAACDAEFPGKTCPELSKASFESAKASNALMTAKIAKVTAGTLTSADLLTDLALSLSSSSLTDPISAWQLDYLESILSTTAGTAKATWQTSIDNYNAASANAWYLWKIAASSASSGTYASSNATYAIFKTAGVDTGASGTSASCSVGGAVASGIACSVLGVTNTQIAADIRNAGFTAAPTSTAMRNFLTEARGYTDGTTYASVVAAINTGGWDSDDYATANSNGGWTSSSADKDDYARCKTSTDSGTGGPGTCSSSRSAWYTIDAPVFASISSTTLSKNDTASTSGASIVTLAATDADGGISYSVSGTNSSSFNVSSSGAVTASAALAAGSYNFNLVATDSTSTATTKAFTLTVADTVAPSFTSSTTASAFAYAVSTSTVVYTAAATDDAAITWSVSGVTGLTINSSGQVKRNASLGSWGAKTLTVTATDASGNVSTQDVSMTVSTPTTLAQMGISNTSLRTGYRCCQSGWSHCTKSEVNTGLISFTFGAGTYSTYLYMRSPRRFVHHGTGTGGSGNYTKPQSYFINGSTSDFDFTSLSCGTGSGGHFGSICCDYD